MATAESFEPVIARFWEYLRVRGYAENTVELKRKALRDFVVWCAERELQRPVDVTRDDVGASSGT